MDPIIPTVDVSGSEVTANATPDASTSVEAPASAVVESAEISTQSIETDANAPSPATATEPSLDPVIPSAVESHIWNCPVCTMENAEEVLVCIACETPRGESATATLAWWCQVCTLANSFANSR